MNKKLREKVMKDINDFFLTKNKKINSVKIKKNPEFLELMKSLIPNVLKTTPDIKITDIYWCIKNEYNEIPKCKTCGKHIPLKIEYSNKEISQGYVRKYCSIKCFNNDLEVKEKASKREKEKAPERLEKRKKTIIEKYGSLDNWPGMNNKKNKKIKKKNLNQQLINKLLNINNDMKNEVFNFIKSIYSGEIIRNSRNIIKPLELDLYLPEFNLAIEFDGLYWHSDKYKDKNYHLQKTEACEKQSIHLLHIFENEWIDPIKQDIWKSVIKYKLNLITEKYYARKLEIKEVPNKEAEAFLNENHLQGYTPAKINLGLYEQDNLISIATFSKPRFNKKYDFELIRFASKKYGICTGCASKLLNYFDKKFNNPSLISYANRRWAYTNSNLYRKLGFSFLKISQPNYFYFKNFSKSYKSYESYKSYKLHHRSKFQKHKLKFLNETKDFYDPKLSESQIMKNAGYHRIYDSGNLVYERITN